MGAVLAVLAVVTPVSAADRPVADAVVRDAQPVSFPSAAMDQTSSVTTAIDCPADGECVAGGEVQSPTDATQMVPFIVVQKLGVWGTAQVLSLDAATFGQVDVVRIVAIDCPAVGECEAVGILIDTSADDFTSIRVAVRGGAASTPEVLNFPDPASYTVGDIRVADVSCGAVGDCLAVGAVDLLDNTQAQSTDAVQWVISGGVVSAGATLPLPASVLDRNTFFLATATAVSCPSVGECVVTGASSRAPLDPVTWVRIQSAGVWADATAVTFPAGATIVLQSLATFTSSRVECSSAGECAVVGGFQAAASNGEIAPFGASITAGALQQAVPFVLPSSIDEGSGAWASTLACADGGTCVALIDGNTVDGDPAVARVELAAGSWSEAVIFPDVPTSAYVFGQSVSCRSAGNCVAALVSADGSFVAIQSDGVWNPPVLLDSAGAERAAPYTDLFASSCAAGGRSCVLVGMAGETRLSVVSLPTTESLGPSAARELSPSQRLRVPQADERVPQANGTVAQATPPWALVQTVDWPVPEPAPTPPRYAG